MPREVTVRALKNTRRGSHDLDTPPELFRPAVERRLDVLVELGPHTCRLVPVLVKSISKC